MGSGIDVAVESCDVVLMRNDLTGVPAALALSRAVITNIKQNVFWAVAFNTIGIPVAASRAWVFSRPNPCAPPPGGPGQRGRRRNTTVFFLSGQDKHEQNFHRPVILAIWKSIAPWPELV
jgi:hypothetical protein